MKKITIVLLSVIFVLVTGSIHYISADDSTDSQEPGLIVTTEDSKYQLHIQVILRNAEGHLIGTTEGTYGSYVPHKLTDNSFDTLFGEKEIVTVDGIKYEKVQFYDSYKNKALWDTGFATGSWIITMCEEKCLNIFQARNVQVVVEGEDTIAVKWTILRSMN